MTKWMGTIGSLLGSAIFLTGASANAQSRVTVLCSPGSICRSNGAVANGGPANGQYKTSNGVPEADAAEGADPEQQKIWDVARQLRLDSNQRAQLKSSLNAQNEESAALDKALNDARAALAQAVQEGRTSLESEIENFASAKAKVQESQLRRWASLYAALTPDQQRRMLMLGTPLSEAATVSGVPQKQITQAQ